ncbi:MAG: thioredoxin family protein [Candidatus Latescibacteria bacterium]|nr:thioredoxin family protein [Candidatus Latescibacterota bacterium]
MKRYALSGLIVVTAAVVLFGLTSEPMAKGKVRVGEAALDFELTDTDGRSVKLSDYRGMHVVLEWINYDCPFVRKHYESGNMQALQKKYTDKGVIWLAICSNRPGSQGNFENAEIERRRKNHGSTVTAYLRDDDGSVGRLYGATNTPHMYIVNPAGTLVYMGAIDSIASSRQSDIEEADNYMTLSLDAVLEGKAVPVSATKAYGCTIKY